MLEFGSRQNMTAWILNGLEVNASLTRWFVSFAELSCCLGLGLCLVVIESEALGQSVYCFTDATSVQ